VLDRALHGLPHRQAFVEIGGGTGFMLRYGREHGFTRQIEIEPSADAERRYRPVSEGSRFLRGVFSGTTLPPGSASLVCFFQVLDHISDPRAFLADVWRALAPGGAAVCVTHDTRALSARLLGERSPIYDIEHTYLFHRKNLPALFGAVGFERMEAFAVANDYALRYWLHLFPLPVAVKPGLLRVFDRVGLSDRKVSLYAGNFAVIARKPVRDVLRESA
jgi:SAM-dependent methyltransferase